MKRTAPRRCRGAQRLAQYLRPAVAEALDQRLIETRGILIEQAAHINRRHGGCRIGGAEACKLQRRTVTVTRIGLQGSPKGLDRTVAIAALRADFAERKPGRRELRRAL